MTLLKKNSDVLGAGDPGALDFLFGILSDTIEDKPSLTDFRNTAWLFANSNPLFPPSNKSKAFQKICETVSDETIKNRYLGSIGWQLAHIYDEEKYSFITNFIETTVAEKWIDPNAIYEIMKKGEIIEDMLLKLLPGVKTFGLSGAESYLALVDRIITNSVADFDTDSLVVGGMHRGRLAQMALLFEKPLERIITETKEFLEYDRDFGGSWDSIYHLGWSGVLERASKKIPVWVSPHPSHLSLVASVSMGYAKSLKVERKNPLHLALHTDAAFSGQGINVELLQLADLPSYSVGGTIHIVLNNQLGFTTNPSEVLTALTSVDYGKITNTPILHINSDDPDAVALAGRFAVEFRHKFHSDVVLDLLTYRRRGHNEVDEPKFTQPKLYDIIEKLESAADRYAKKYNLKIDFIEFQSKLESAFKIKEGEVLKEIKIYPELKPDYISEILKPVPTGIDKTNLKNLEEKINYPGEIKLHPKIENFIKQRKESFLGEGSINWATAEALAIASLLDEKKTVRFSGQDSVRGAFTQRHFELHCQTTGNTKSIFSDWDGYQVFDTPLSEVSILGFEYGYSLLKNHGLTIWETQFGDFLNVAQSIFDQFVVCGENKWLQKSNLVILLPHGIDGGGPDHATGRPERLLSACASSNIVVANCSTPANYFHILRRQVRANWQKPLIILSPKMLLRYKSCVSKLDDFSGHFKTVLHDNRTKAKKVIMATGKLAVLINDLIEEKKLKNLSILTLEQLYPLDVESIRSILQNYKSKDYYWAQEEPENMGYFLHLDRQLEKITNKTWKLISRPASPAPSSGPGNWDRAYLDEILQQIESLN